MIPTNTAMRWAGVGTAACLCLALAGCASQEVAQASNEIAVSDAKLADALRADAARVAPEEVVAARTEVDMAKAAYQDDDYEMASLMAQEAQADASLAESKARSAAAQAAVTALQENMRALRAEMNRSQ